MKSPLPRSMGVGRDLCARRKDGSEFNVDVALGPNPAENKVTVVVRDIHQRRTYEKRQSFLADLAERMNHTLVFEERIQTATKLCSKFFGSWCAVEIFTSEGKLKKIALAHDGVSRLEQNAVYASTELSVQLEDKFRRVVEEGVPIVLSRAEVSNLLKSNECFNRKVDFESCFIAPLVSLTKPYGAILIAKKSGTFEDDEFLFIRKFANNIAVSADNARLYEAARSAVRAREDIVAIVSHDLKNPLGAIDLNIQLLESFLDNDSALEVTRLKNFLSLQKRSVGNALGLVNDLLDFAKMEAGKFVIEKKLFRVNSLLEEIKEVYQVLATDRKLNFQMEMLEKDVWIEIDRPRFLQVLSNLLGNALKFTPSGGLVTLKVSISSECVRFSVSDTGPGIAPEALPFLFDRYWQPEETRKQGTGLGLSIVKEIVEAHGGSITVQSDLGKGTEFAIEVRLAGYTDASMKTVEKPSQNLPENCLTGCHILLVDDDEVNLSVMSKVLVKAGANVTRANSAETALKILQTEAPEILLTDLDMPQVSGFELAERFRKMSQLRGNRVAVAALTGFTSDADRNKILEAGFDKHLAKDAGLLKLVIEVKELSTQLH